MPKKAKELTPVSVKRITKKGLHAVGGVAGLHLQVTKSGARTWILRASIGDKRRDIGLGGYPDVSLAEARDKARIARTQIEQGIDPVQVKKDTRNALRAAKAAEITFEKSAKDYIKAKKEEWKNKKHIKQWESTLEQYAYPVIGTMQVKDVELSHIVKILEPIWKTKTETAVRLRGRLESVLDWAAVRQYRSQENPARWKGYLDKILASPNKIKTINHFKALPPKGVGAFISKLREQEGTGARALEFLVLTAARSGEVRGATWQEINLKEKLWIIPAQRMKAKKEHRVPLCKRALEILKELPRFKNENIVFAAPRGGVLSDMALTAVTRRMKIDAVPHGFRSTFRDWVAEETNYPNEVAEMALAHTIESKVEAAYRRGDLFEKRRRMMDEWEEFCGTIIDTSKTSR